MVVVVVKAIVGGGREGGVRHDHLVWSTILVHPTIRWHSNPSGL